MLRGGRSKRSKVGPELGLAVLNADFRTEVFPVKVNGSGGYTEIFGNFFCRPTLSDKIGDLDLARGKVEIDGRKGSQER